MLVLNKRLALSAYSVYADNCLSACTLYADKKYGLDFLSACSVQKYYILNLYPVPRREPREEREGGWGEGVVELEGGLYIV